MGYSLYLLYLLASRLSCAVPPRLAYPACDLIGDLFCLLSLSSRQAVQSNLRHVLGARQPPGQLVRQVFRSGVRNYYDTFRIPAISGAELEELVESQGWEHLDAARAAGSGAILVGAHLSSVALAAQLIAHRGYPLVTVVEPVRPPALFDLLADARAGHGVRVLPIGPNVMAELIGALRRNEVVGLIADRDVGGTGIDVPFFDAPAFLPSTPAVLCLRTGAPLMVALSVRKSDASFRGIIEPPLPPTRSGDLRRDVEDLTQRIAERFEYHIRMDPTQWTVFQPVWAEER